MRRILWQILMRKVLTKMIYTFMKELAMKKRDSRFLLAIVLAFFAATAFAQTEDAAEADEAEETAEAPAFDSVLSDSAIVFSYQRNFARAGLSTKLELLSGAAKIPSINMTPLYKDALDFVISSHSLFGEDKQIVDMAVLAMKSAATGGDSSILESVFEVFNLFTNVSIKVAAIEAIAALSGPESEGLKFLAGWFDSALNDSASGSAVNTEIMCAALNAFASIGSADAFPLVFRAATAGLSPAVTAAAEKALLSFDDGFAENIKAIVSEGDPAKTQAAFAFVRKKASLSSIELGEIAEAVFASMLDLDGSGNLDAQPVLLSAMETLTELKWGQASQAVLQYFYRIQSEYPNDNSSAEKLIPVINCLGAMGTSEAAQALSIFLGLLNSETEQSKTCNVDLMLSIINALGDLGDKAAFDYLLYVDYLEYPEAVKKASRDALARLKW